jgi:hypothetical protein
MAKEESKITTPKPKVKEGVLGALVQVRKGEAFIVEPTAECAKKLQKLGLTDYLE